MFYTVYKTINIVNGRFYIGKHKTKDINDSYLGSGKLLKQAIKKYGKQSFRKEILFVFDNEDEMNNKERELVTLSESSYNLCEGGNGGFGYINSSGISKFKGKRHTEESKKKMAHFGNTHKKGIPISEEQKKAISIKNSIALKGKPKSDEHRKNISEAIKRKHREKLAGMV